MERQHAERTLNACVARCLTSVDQLRAWENEALRLSCAGTPSSPSLEENCAQHGFGFFHLTMQYWAVSLLLSARCGQLVNRVSEPTPSLDALTSLLLDPQTCAVNIAAHAHRYFAPTTGFIGPQNASFPLGAALHFLAATGQQDKASWESQQGLGDRSGEVGVKTALTNIRVLFRDVSRARSTAEFLRSMATDPAPPELKGDVNKDGEHEKMAREWFKV